MEDTPNQKIVDTLRQRLQFVIVVVIFFPTFLQSVFTLGNNIEEYNKFNMSWGVVLATFLLIYLTIEYRIQIKKLSEVTMKSINNLLLAYVVLFFPVLAVSGFEKYQYTWFFIAYKYILSFSFILIVWIPVAIFLVSLFNFGKCPKISLKWHSKKR